MHSSRNLTAVCICQYSEYYHLSSTTSIFLHILVLIHYCANIAEKTILWYNNGQEETQYTLFTIGGVNWDKT